MKLLLIILSIKIITIGNFEQEWNNHPNVDDICLVRYITNIEKNNISDVISNYPNPFNQTTTWKLNLLNQRYQLVVYNVLGEEIARIFNKEFGRGIYYYKLNKVLPSGIYFYRLRAGKYTETKKMLMLK